MHPIVSSYIYRGATIKVDYSDESGPLYRAFRLNKNGRNQILTIWGFRDVIGPADPTRHDFNEGIIELSSLDLITHEIDWVIKDEEWTAIADKTSDIYKSLMENTRGDNVNRDEIWAAACLETGLKNTRANAS